MMNLLPHRTDARNGAHLLRSIALLWLLSLLCSASLAAQDVDTVDFYSFINGGCRVFDEDDNFASHAFLANSTVDLPIYIELRIGGTASFGEDHRQSDTTIVIEPGDYITPLSIPLLDDPNPEGLEYIELRATIVEGPGRLLDTTPMRIYLFDGETPKPNLLEDGGFETDPTSWVLASDGVAIATDQVVQGNRSLKLEASSLSAREAYQDVAVMPGARYLYDVYRRNEGVKIEDYVQAVQLVWFDAAGGEVDRQTIMSHGFNDGPSWYETTGCFVTPESATTLRVHLSIPVDPDNQGAVWFDELAVIPVDESSDVREEPGKPVRLDLSLSGESVKHPDD